MTTVDSNETTSPAAGFEVYDAKPWLKHYPDGKEPERENFGNSLGEVVRNASRKYAAQPAFSVCLPTGTTGTVTFAEVDRYSDQFAAYLRYELGLDKGDRVAIQAPNCIAYPSFLFGAAKAECVLVNINPLYTVPENDHALTDSGARLLVMIDMFADNSPRCCPRARSRKC